MNAMQAIGYVRVSTAKQADAGLSLDTQRQAIAGYCALDGLEVLEIVADEGEPAKHLAGRSGRRPELQLGERRAASQGK